MSGETRLDLSALKAAVGSLNDLPWKVDVVDWAIAAPSFQAIIARDKVVLQVA